MDTPDFTDVVVPVSGLRHAVAVDFDPVDKFMYWSDDEKLEIKRSRLNGTGNLPMNMKSNRLIIIIIMIIISNGSRAECCPIQSVIILLINKIGQTELDDMKTHYK